jgi:hypothetical protein
MPDNAVSLLAVNYSKLQMISDDVNGVTKAFLPVRVTE